MTLLEETAFLLQWNEASGIQSAWTVLRVTCAVKAHHFQLLKTPCTVTLTTRIVVAIATETQLGKEWANRTY